MPNKPKAPAQPAPKKTPPPTEKKPATLRDKIAARKKALDAI